MKPNVLKVCSCGLFFLFSVFLYSQENQSIIDGIITDRPDETEAPFLVPKGYLQIETGAAYENNSFFNVDEKLITYNTTLLRYGILENLELRLGTDYIKSELSGSFLDQEFKGFVPLLVGAKIGIAEEKGMLPQIGFIGHLMLPFTASPDFKPETTGVDFRFAFTHTLTAKSDFSYNLGAKWHDDNAEATYIYTIAYGYEIIDRLGFYLELYGEFPEDNRADHFWDCGFTYLVQDNLQLDILAGTGFDNHQNLMVGGGISYRIPR